MRSSLGVVYDAERTVGSATHLSREDTLSLPRDQYAVLKITTALSSIRGLAGLERPLLELIFEVLPAASGAVMLLDPPSTFGWAKSGNGPVRVSKALLDVALQARLAVLSNDVAGGGRPAMAAPLLVFDRVFGGIYLESGNPEQAFDLSHLHLLSTIAAIAAMSLDYTRRLDALERENLLLRTQAEASRSLAVSRPLDPTKTRGQ